MSRNTTILLIEDNAITRKMMSVALEAKGYRVLIAEDTRTALERMMEKPDLVLVDLALPDETGFEVVQHLRELAGSRSMPILACVGFISQADEARVAAVGFDDVITKPIEPSKLIHIIRAHVPDGWQDIERFGAGRTALVVDDDPIQLRLALHRLSRLGFDVVGACDGEDALGQARLRKPDVVVSDVMMPRIDGFGLCQQLRADPNLCDVPIILTTNSYVENGDLDLARRVGADDLVLRTPELREVIASLREKLGAAKVASSRRLPAAKSADIEIEEERNRRTRRQLDKQVELNASLMQRCATLSAELAVLSGISGAISQGLDVNTALEAALAACMDAGGLARGALYVFENETLSVRTFGDANRAQLEALFTCDELRTLLKDKKTTALPHPAGTERDSEILQNGILVPLVASSEVLGGLLLISREANQADTDRTPFSEGVGSQIALALVLADSFAQRAESERLAHRNAALLHSILDSIPEGVIAVDSEGVFTHRNSAADNIMSWDANTESMHVWTAKPRFYRGDGITPIPPDELPLVVALRGERVEGLDLMIRGDEVDERRWLSVNASPLRGNDASVSGAVAVFRDVSAEKRAQAQLMMSDRMASVGMLAAGVAHEINNPLSALMTNLDCLKKDLEKSRNSKPDFEEMTEIIVDAREAATRVHSIVNDLRLFSRGDDETLGRVNVEDVLESSLRMAWNELRHRARIVRSYGDVPPVAGNESRLGQVFLNLIMNAAHAMTTGDSQQNTLHVSTVYESDTGRVRIDIKDTGCGIPDEIRGRLFNPFVTTKARGLGTGLGLTICQRIVMALGGEILVRSEADRGTTFSIRLIPAQGTTAPPPASIKQTAPAKRVSVLVLDDDTLVIRSLERALAGHEVVATTDGAAALDLCEQRMFDVILCDVMMPDMNGADFYRQLSVRAPLAVSKVVFMTGGAFTADAQDFLDMNSNPRLEKPIQADLLEGLLRMSGTPRSISLVPGDL